MDCTLAVEFLEATARRAAMSRDRIVHCLAQLNDDDMWWSPGSDCNPVGVILQHLQGNLRQWVLSGLGGEVDIRDRPREFEVSERSPKDVLKAGFTELLDRVLTVLRALEPSSLLERRVIQGFDESPLSAILSVITHLDLHAGQILYITRLRIGERYREQWHPATKEQGA